MGFRMRKSINLGGGFRINLSKSGIGYSWGVPGYRVTRTARGTTRRTFSVPGTGLSYVEETGRRKRPQSAVEVDNSYVRPIVTADMAQLKAANEDDITNTIERTLRFNRLSNILLWCALLAFINGLFLLVPIVGVALKVVLRRVGVIELDYSFDAEKGPEYEKKINAWLQLAESKKFWQITKEKTNLNTKKHAGAKTSVERMPCAIKKDAPFYIRANVPIVQLKLVNETMLLLPDKILIVRGTQVASVSYVDVTVRVSTVRFVEEDGVPADAKVVGHTWKYVNKSGTPDRRFKDNRQLPICLYGTVEMTSSNGINLEMHISNLKNTRDFGEIVADCSLLSSIKDI